MEAKTSKRQLLIILGLAIVTVISAVLFSNRFSLRFDTSSDKLNTISQVSKNLYKEIPEKVRISYYVSRTLTERHPGPKAIEDLLRSFAAASKGKITLDVIDPSSKNTEDALQAQGIAPQQMQVNEKNEMRVVLVYSGLVVQYLDKSRVVPFLISTETLEYDLDKAIRDLVKQRTLTASVLIGDSDKTYENNFKYLDKALQDSGWTIQPITPGSAIPEGTTVLFVIGSSGLTDKDAYRIDDYVARGGSVFFSLLGVNVSYQQGVNAEPFAQNPVLDLVASYGAKVERNLLMDESAVMAPFRTRTQFGGSAISYVQYPHWIQIRPEYSSPDNPISSQLQGRLVLFWASPITLVPISGIDEKVLVSTTPKAWLQKSLFNIDPQMAAVYNIDKKETEGQYKSVVSLLGVFPQVYKGKMPTQANVTFPTLPETSKPARILVVGSADFASDLMNVASADFNADFVTSAADWLGADSDLLQIKTRGQRDSRFAKVAEPATKAFLINTSYIMNVGLIPLVVVIFGVLRFVKRRRLARKEAAIRTGAPVQGGKQ